jgi:hypothetical protein
MTKAPSRIIVSVGSTIADPAFGSEYTAATRGPLSAIIVMGHEAELHSQAAGARRREGIQPRVARDVCVCLTPSARRDAKPD